jgi:undecaprenyl-diphosphatase
MLEQFILGAIQGIAEWLPISSDGVIFLIKVKILQVPVDMQKIMYDILFLHLGTFFAALVYFWKEVKHLIFSAFSYKKSREEDRKTIWFIVLVTVISGVLGYLLLLWADQATDDISGATQIFVIVVGLLLALTGIIQLRAKNGGQKDAKDLKTKDSLLLGLVQGLSVLPGLSRSGLTVSALLLTKFSKKSALKLSFILSLPIVLAGNIILNFDQFLHLGWDNLLGILSAFVFGLITIKLLLKLADKINFGYFVLVFSALTIISAFI